jgi:transcriptional regulator with GAF, ATPase, and Fis domain
LLATWEARRRLAEDGAGETIVGCSDELRGVELMAHRYAALDEPVLIHGETGVGKELIAHTVHALSRRGDKPLCTINCAAVPDELIASELFGHRRGAFTGAVRDQRGRFEMADGATLFLDEIGEMGPGLQAALLRVLEYGEVQQLGDEGRMRRINVRIIAATNRDLSADVAARRFRSDLYYRLTPLAIEVPPLRWRPEDIPVLVRHFVARIEQNWGRPLQIVSRAVNEMIDYPFPGNVRELRNVVLRAAASCCEGRIDSVPLPQLAEPFRSQRPVAVPAVAVAGSGPAYVAPGGLPRGVGGNGHGPHASGNGHGHYAAGNDHTASGHYAGGNTHHGTGAFVASHSGNGRKAGSTVDLAVVPGGGGGARSAPQPRANGNGRSSNGSDPLNLEHATEAHLRKVLTIAKGNVSQAARMLDIPRTTLQSKLRRYGVH